MDSEGKSAIVTGAASCIGRASAVALAQAGCAQLRLVDFNKAGLKQALQLCADNACMLRGSLRYRATA